ncbi:acetyl-CoA acetyltransferase [Rubrivirga sp. SAORIC476]|uniref:thiolase family protein n=1 Tax=Rubrivirga sp. SAORIC476 TaxID=1961794 RepID=UPI000BA91A8B|nr:thiolase family protein [Rubrivirga sp. SAORIC476]PAP80980.1 acetyl-CoA acetyltransferase [Rubrivirga sp. SAORIC476]
MASVILSAARTPVGSFGGALSTVPAPSLGATAITGALDRAGVATDQVDEVILGNVVTAGEGQAPARQAALGAGLPQSVACMTINKVCGSGMKAVMLADQAIRAGDAEVVVAGGMENMSMAPFYLPKARYGYGYGNGELVDGLFHDGLRDAYDGVAMGVAADQCGVTCNVPRERQDAFSIESYTRAQASVENGAFAQEIVPVTISGRKGDTVVDTDEEPAKTNFDKIPQLRAVFTKDGTVTAANASTINDGAAALVVASEEWAEANGKTPMARIVASAQHSQAPMEFTTAPIEAVNKVLGKANLTLDDIDLFEVNEAFAVVALAAQDALGIPSEKLNVRGGSVAVGHPIGASGARILTTLLHAMVERGARYGLAAICIGGGEATAIVLERN